MPDRVAVREGVRVPEGLLREGFRGRGKKKRKRKHKRK